MDLLILVSEWGQRSNMKKKTFTYRDSKNVEHVVSFNEGDFDLSQENISLSDTKLKSKPTTFFKDAMKRFYKNKSSVAGGVILGAILLLTIFVPIFNTNSLNTADPALAYQTFLAPKLFEAGTGFWDGTTEFKNMPIDFDWDSYYKDETYSGVPATSSNSSLRSDAIVGDISFSQVGEYKISNNATSYARGGSIRLTSTENKNVNARLDSPATSFDFASYNYSLKVVTLDVRKENFDYGDAGVFDITFQYKLNAEDDYSTIVLDANLTGASEKTYELSSIAELKDKVIASGRFELSLHPTEVRQNVLLKQSVFNIESKTSTPVSQTQLTEMKNISCKDANLTMYRGQVTSQKQYMYTSNDDMNVFEADYVVGSFRYDTYLATFSDYVKQGITPADLKKYESNGWMNFSYSVDDFISSSLKQADIDKFLAGISMTEDGKAHCPLQVDEEHPLAVKVEGAGKLKTASFTGTISRYREYGYSKMPKFLFGTDNLGRDLFKLVFNGLRFSVILGVATTLVNLIFGLIWGAISGYFGGWVDIVMERVCEILGGIPWVVVMTLILINKPKDMSTIVMVGIALCATGWLGTASITRTQFYRFKDREYILAARTLGASDTRLIFRHILPNAIGTLVTSSVLMIPSVIFSEASLSYLRLVNGMQGFGSTLSDNQSYLTTYPYLILVPSIIMALIMISFNLFGNGLRDAFNPSLKGGE